MATVYRIIKIEGTEEAINFQLHNSVLAGMKYVNNDKITITIKDRNDDPCEKGFFDDCLETRQGMVRRADAELYLKQLKEKEDASTKKS